MLWPIIVIVVGLVVGYAGSMGAWYLSKRGTLLIADPDHIRVVQWLVGLGMILGPLTGVAGLVWLALALLLLWL